MLMCPLDPGRVERGRKCLKFMDIGAVRVYMIKTFVRYII